MVDYTRAVVRWPGSYDQAVCTANHHVLKPYNVVNIVHTRHPVFARFSHTTSSTASSSTMTSNKEWLCIPGSAEAIVLESATESEGHLTIHFAQALQVL